MSEYKATRQDYEKYVRDVVSRSIAKQEQRGHPPLPALTMLIVAESGAVYKDICTMVLRYGDTNTALLDLTDEALRDVTRTLGLTGLRTYIAARAIVSDGTKTPEWERYRRENAYRWPGTST